MNTVISGFDPVAVDVDAVGCRVIGLDPAEILHLRFAHERELGRMLLEEIEIVGTSIQSVLHPLKVEISKPSQDYDQLAIVEAKGYSGCSATNRMARSFLSRRDIQALGLVTVVIEDTEGIKYAPKGWCILVGNCAIRSNRGQKRTKIGGCPPPGYLVRQSPTR